MTTSLKITKKAKDGLELARLMDFTDLVDFDRLPGTFRDKILAVEERLKLLPDIEFQYDHSFYGGIYLRTMYAPKGTLMTSFIYRKPHQCLISRGVVSYRSEVLGGKITGPCRFVADAGSKRVVYCHTDMVWTTAIKTDATNVADAERDIYLTTYEEWDKECDVNLIEVGA